MASIPTIVIVHGAWHSAAHWESFAKNLPYKSVVPQLTGVNPANAATESLAKDTATVLAALNPLLEAGEDILLVGHSYGANPVADVATGLSKKAREKEGKKGGVVGVVFISTSLAKPGLSISETYGNNELPPWMTFDGINGVLRVNSAIETFYHDAPPAVQTHAAELIGTQSMMTMLTPSAQPAWATNEYDGRLVYIKCMDDRVLSPEVQEMMLVICGAKDKVRIVEIMSSHSPWLSVPDTFEGILDGLAKEWV